MDHRSRTNLTAAAWGAIILMLVSLTGCKPSLGWHGRTNTFATYNGRELSARLPATIDVLTAAAAGEAALIGRGYVIGRREGTQGKTTIVGQTPAADWRRHVDRSVVFRAIQRKRGVHVEIHINPLPNEAESRAVLETTLAQLGM